MGKFEIFALQDLFMGYRKSSPFNRELKLSQGSIDIFIQSFKSKHD